jgi:hypothetical protein
MKLRRLLEEQKTKSRLDTSVRFPDIIGAWSWPV